MDGNESNTTDDEGGESNVNPVVIPWTGVYVTALVSLGQGLFFYFFFLLNRRKCKKLYEVDEDEKALDLYETRQHNRAYRSPKPFGSWYRDVWNVSQAELLRCVGLDAYMYLRTFMLGARICAIGVLLSCVLVPVYFTGERRGVETEQFNQLTLARVEQNSPWRLYVTVAAWWVFCAWTLHCLWEEWKLYFVHRTNYLARGDMDMPLAVRYAIRVEQVSKNSDTSVYQYFERLFPGKVQHVHACLQTAALEDLIEERQASIIKLEGAQAAIKASPNNPRPMVRIKFVGKVDAIEHYEGEISRLTPEIDGARKIILDKVSHLSVKSDDTTNVPAEGPRGGDINANAGTGEKEESIADVSEDLKTSTAFVTFTSLRAKQAAIQCELTGDPDSMVVFSAPDPASTLWQNIGVSLPQQKILAFNSSLLWMVGILFWAVPVSFVTSIANLNSILEAFKLEKADPTAAWYGLIAGLLPVVALAILMAVLYMAINYVAVNVVRYKSRPEVDSYCLFWHMLFQFANLWLILIGGSLFGQIETLMDKPEKFVDVIATALPGACTFFVNMILVSAFAAFGMELAQIPKYVVGLVMDILKPQAARTQRQLDETKKADNIDWGQQVPPVVFIFLVVFLYCPIVPIIELFGFCYFFGMYIVMKHQCLHVYATDFEGGGDATWRQTFPFIMACLYTGEAVFIAYMGIKEAPIAGTLGFVPLIATILFHRVLQRKLVDPISNLSLETAATVDISEGESVLGEDLYIQPALDETQDEREPMPYRRSETANH